MNPDSGLEVGAPLARVLVVDDEYRFCEALASILADEYHVETASGMAEAMARLRSGTEFDVILSDVMMPGGSGLALYESIVRELPWEAARVVFMTGGLSDALRERMARLPNRCLDKPFEVAQLRSVVHASLLGDSARADDARAGASARRHSSRPRPMAGPRLAERSTGNER